MINRSQPPYLVRPHPHHITMKINPRYYPAIILVTFALFMLIGFLLGLRPQHGGGSGRESFAPVTQYALIAFEALA